ncbi:insulinase family protein [Synechococcus sp. CBW1107]|uniref:M16 family metallopeptidase n=1 Tax=Synechococcus sp. CBW1107 TaxID=2789857 RepID=UPI0018CD168D|nr:pitrilysin family protein [Synechococcus sp. CBW1107]QPN56114.1 insulinase family protein [Synechococcus sp. CBW1107]
MPLPSPPPLQAADSFEDPCLLRLANGVDVVSLRQEQAPLVCLDFWCQAGSAGEGPGQEGMAHFLEHMVFKGSEHLEAGQFDHRIESLGGSSNAATGFDDVHYHVLVPAEAVAEALELLLDLVLKPRLDPGDFRMERQVVLEELAQSEDQPEEVAFQRLLALACPHHPYGRPILGDRKALKAQTPEGMASFHSNAYRPRRCSLALAGAIDQLPIESLLADSALAGLEPLASPSPPGPTMELHPGVHELRLPRLEAARLLMAWQLPAADDQEGVAGADLLTSLLAEGRRSRLVQRLREDLRLVESIDLDLNVLEAGSLALLEAVCAPDQVAAVEEQIAVVWQEICCTPPPESELQRARRLVANGYRFGLESAASVAGLIGHQCLWGRLQPLRQPLELLERWSVERLGAELLPLLAPERACRLLALPA